MIVCNSQDVTRKCPELARMGDRLLHGAAAGSHQDDHALCLGVTGVFHQVIATSRSRGKALEGAAHERGQRVVVRVDGLARLEEHVGVLRRAAQHGAIGVEGARGLQPVLCRDARHRPVRMYWALSGTSRERAFSIARTDTIACTVVQTPQIRWV